VTYFVFRTGLGAICLLAAAQKLRAPRDFFQGVKQYGIVGPQLAPVVGSLLIGAELVIGLLLVGDLVPKLAALGAIVLFGVFAVALGVNIAQKNTAPCHCFGASEVEKISPVALLRALALEAIAIAVLVYALGDTASITRHELLPSLLMAAALVTVTRLSGLFPLAWSFLRAEASMHPTPTRRVSFRHQPLEVPLYPRERP
jgi:uncharacterized membrane protein YphA (DoxX/SURF4 family)